MGIDSSAPEQPRMGDTVRAMVSPARLRLLGALAERPLTGPELSERLGLSLREVMRHLAKLTEVGLVVIPEGGTGRYTLDETTLRALAQSATPERPPPPGLDERPNSDEHPGTTSAAERAKTLRDFFVGPRLKQIPTQRRKLLVILEYLLRRFEPGREYPEREVNALLREAHEDVATLRRDLVEFGYMSRQAGVYRVVASPAPSADAVEHP